MTIEVDGHPFTYPVFIPFGERNVVIGAVPLGEVCGDCGKRLAAHKYIRVAIMGE